MNGITMSVLWAGSSVSLQVSGSAVSLHISGSSVSLQISVGLQISGSAVSLQISGSSLSLQISGSSFRTAKLHHLGVTRNLFLSFSGLQLMIMTVVFSSQGSVVFPLPSSSIIVQLWTCGLKTPAWLSSFCATTPFLIGASQSFLEVRALL